MNVTAPTLPVVWSWVVNEADPVVGTEADVGGVCVMVAA
jgi:hypothetical protein